jgi:hypothetical protein
MNHLSVRKIKTANSDREAYIAAMVDVFVCARSCAAARKSADHCGHI